MTSSCCVQSVRSGERAGLLRRSWTSGAAMRRVLTKAAVFFPAATRSRRAVGDWGPRCRVSAGPQIRLLVASDRRLRGPSSGAGSWSLPSGTQLHRLMRRSDDQSGRRACPVGGPPAGSRPPLLSRWALVRAGHCVCPGDRRGRSARARAASSGATRAKRGCMNAAGQAAEAAELGGRRSPRLWSSSTRRSTATIRSTSTIA